MEDQLARERYPIPRRRKPMTWGQIATLWAGCLFVGGLIGAGIGEWIVRSR